MTPHPHPPSVASPTTPVRPEGSGASRQGADRYVVAIRDAMASGWGLVVAGAHVRTAYEAARTCGRLDDVLLVHARPPALLPFYLGVEARRAPAHWDCGKWGRDSPNGLPAATSAEMVRYGGVTLILDAARPDLVALPIAAAMSAPEAPRVLLVHSWPAPADTGKPPAPALDAFPDASMPTGGGEDALARFSAKPVMEKGPGTVLLRGGGRTVLAQFLPTRSVPGGGTREPRPSMRIAEAEEDGWVGFAEWRAPGLDPGQAEDYARFAWLNGTHRPPPAAAKIAVPTIPAGNLPWIGRRRDPAHAKADADLVEVFGAEAVALQESLADIVPARAVYRAARTGDADRRTQFLRTWPAFRDDLLDPVVAAAADAGDRMAPVLAGIHGMSPALVRRLAGRAKPELWAVLEARYGTGAGPVALSAIGHDRLPVRDDGEGWGALDRLARVAFEILDGAGFHRGDGDAAYRWIGSMLAGIPGRDWPSRAESVGKADSHFHVGSVRDMLRALADHLRGLGVAGSDAALALRLFPEEGGFAGAIAACAAWHAEPVLRLGSHGIGPDAAWDVPFDPVELGEGWRAVPLASMAALISEGSSGPDADGVAGLSHCVASYAPRCMRGDCLIVSVRRDVAGGWERVSTAELVDMHDGTWRIPGRGLRMSLAQHRARGNATPPKEAVDALKRLRIRLDEGIARSSATGSPSGTADPGGAAERHAFAVHGRWRSVLPGRLGRLDRGEFVAHARSVAARVRPGCP